MKNKGLVKDLLELQRMAAVRNIRILAVYTSRIGDDKPKYGSIPEKVLGIDCLPDELYYNIPKGM